jgi:hypothetical protein
MKIKTNTFEEIRKMITEMPEHRPETKDQSP